MRSVGQIASFLRDRLAEPGLEGIDPDSAEFTRAHRAVLDRKPLLRAVMTRTLRRCRDADERYFHSCAATARLELGSGTGLMRELYSDVLTSEVKLVPYVALAARGEELPFRSGILRAIYAINVLHHVSDPRALFREVARVSAPGGGAVFVEPHFGPVARMIYPILFRQERFDMSEVSWGDHRRAHVSTDANQALSYLIFQRDREQWQNEFPELELLATVPHTHVSYLATGGLNFRQLVPAGIAASLIRLEDRWQALDATLGLLQTIVVRRR